MELRYMGFNQKQTTRTFRFARLEKGEPTVQLVITADMSLFRKHQIGIQEAPSLCARKLASSFLPTLRHHYELTNDDLLEYVRARAAIETQRAEARKNNWRKRSASA